MITVEAKSSPAMPSRSRTSEFRTLLAVAAASPRTINTLGTYRRAKGAGTAFRKYKRAAILDCLFNERNRSSPFMLLRSIDFDYYLPAGMTLLEILQRLDPYAELV